MYPYIRCANCNTSLGEYYCLYVIMKNHLYDTEFKKNNINSSNSEHLFNNIQSNNLNIETKEIFDILHIKNYCCKKKILTNVTFNSLIY